MRISDWSSDVCSSDLTALVGIADITRAGVADKGGSLERVGRTRCVGGAGTALVGIADITRAGVADKGGSLERVGRTRCVGGSGTGLVGVAGITRGGVPGKGGSLKRVGRTRCHGRDLKSVVWGTSVSVRVDLGGRGSITKDNMKKKQN